LQYLNAFLPLPLNVFVFMNPLHPTGLQATLNMKYPFDSGTATGVTLKIGCQKIGTFKVQKSNGIVIAGNRIYLEGSIDLLIDLRKNGINPKNHNENSDFYYIGKINRDGSSRFEVSLPEILVSQIREQIKTLNQINTQRQVQQTQKRALLSPAATQTHPTPPSPSSSETSYLSTAPVPPPKNELTGKIINDNKLVLYVNYQNIFHCLAKKPTTKIGFRIPENENIYLLLSKKQVINLEALLKYKFGKKASLHSLKFKVRQPINPNNPFLVILPTNLSDNLKAQVQALKSANRSHSENPHNQGQQSTNPYHLDLSAVIDCDGLKKNRLETLRKIAEQERKKQQQSPSHQSSPYTTAQPPSPHNHPTHKQPSIILSPYSPLHPTKTGHRPQQPHHTQQLYPKISYMV